jgi:hypothetical protein
MTMNIGSEQYMSASKLGHLISRDWLGRDLPEVTTRLVDFIGGITREEAIRVSLRNEPNHPFNRLMTEVTELLGKQRKDTPTSYGFIDPPVLSPAGVLVRYRGHYIHFTVRKRKPGRDFHIYFIVCSVCGDFQANRFNQHQFIEREMDWKIFRPCSAHDRAVCRCGMDILTIGCVPLSQQL